MITNTFLERLNSVRVAALVILFACIAATFSSSLTLAAGKYDTLKPVDRVKAYQYYYAISECRSDSGGDQIVFGSQTVGVGHLIDSGDGEQQCSTLIEPAARALGFNSPSDMGLTRSSEGVWSGNKGVRDSILQKIRDKMFGSQEPKLDAAMQHFLYAQSFIIACSTGSGAAASGEFNPNTQEKIKTVNANGEVVEQIWNYRDGMGYKSVITTLAKDSIDNSIEPEYECRTLANRANQTAAAYKTWFENNRAIAQPTTGNAVTGNGSGEDAKETCNVAGVGWIVCPVATLIGQVTDGIYALIEQLLVFNVQDPFGDNALFRAWVNIRNLANIAFIFVFFAIIFSQATSIGIGNYGIKKTLPRLVVAAILVNISYYLCIFAIDVSNIIGAGIDGLLKTALSGVGSGQQDGLNLSSWISNALIGGGAAAAFFATSSAIAAGGTVATILGGIGLTFGLAALIAVLTALVVLVGRQAILILLIIISPLAFVAFILPNTEDLFNKWRKLFITMLVFYPLVALLFTGSQIAAGLMRSASGNSLVDLFSIGVQAFPLFALPFILKFSGGLLGRIAGVVNNPNKGPFDKMRKAGQERIDAAKNKNLTRARLGEIDNKRLAGRMSARAVRNRDARLQKYEGWEYESKRAKADLDAKRLQDTGFASQVSNADAYKEAYGGDTVAGQRAFDTASARSQAKGITQLNSLRGEERKAGIELIEEQNVTNSQWLDLQTYGKVMLRDAKGEIQKGTDGRMLADPRYAQIQGDFFQAAALARTIPQVQPPAMYALYGNAQNLSPAARDTAYYQLSQAFSNIKAKSHTLNAEELLTKVRDGIEISQEDYHRAATKQLSGLTAGIFSGQSDQDFRWVREALTSGQYRDTQQAQKLIDLAKTSLSDENLKGNFTTASRAAAEAISTLDVSSLPPPITSTGPTPPPAAGPGTP